MKHLGRNTRNAIEMNVFVAAVVIFGLALSGMSSAATPSYFVSPQGDDASTGSIDRPWRTLKHALQQLSAGDVLNLRQGTYFEHDIRLRLKGSAAAPITIRAYPGERAVVDGRLPEISDEVPNSNWEVVDERIRLYRSRRSVGGSFVRAWLGTNEQQLVEYSDRWNLESVTYDAVNRMRPFYMGPGVQLRGDGHVYVRLQQNPSDLVDAKGNWIAAIPSDVDPGRNRLVVSTSHDLIILDGAEHVVFEGLTFAHAERILDTKAATHHIEVKGCKFHYGTYGILIRNGSHDWDVRESEFDNGLPEYVYWTDVKNGSRETSEAYPEFQSVAIGGALSGVRVHDCLFQRSFDAIHVQAGTVGAAIHDNVFRVIRDDAIEVETATADVEIAHNILWRVGSGISHTESAGDPGPVYIHHNVIDNSVYQHGGRPGNYREHDWPVWTTIDPFSGHGSAARPAWWRVYNNTIVTRRSGYRWNGSGPSSVAGNKEKYVYNNIFYVLDDRVIYRDDWASEGSHYDGNVMFRRMPGRLPLLVHFGGGGGDYPSLASFRERSGTAWEASGLEVDPGFDVPAFEEPDVVGVSMWERYRPTNPAVFTRGFAYLGLGWPGTDGIDYRGAVPRDGVKNAAGTRNWVVRSSEPNTTVTQKR